MSEKQPISIDAKDPEYYAELLRNTSGLANRRLPSDERPCPDIPGIQDVVSPPSRRLQTLLDVLAEISLCQRGNVSATMACLKDDSGTLETRLYIAFNREDDEAAHRCPQHLETIFNMLRQVPYKPPAMDGSPKVIANLLEIDFIEICRRIHNYSFDTFVHRVVKHKHKLSDIRGYIEQDQTHFPPQHRSTLVVFLQHVDMIIMDVANAQATKEQELPAISIRMLLSIYSYWTEHNLLPKDALADTKVTLLDSADMWLADVYHIGFQLRRWALKIMSFLISANRLFILTQSYRLRKLILGKFSVQVLTSPTTAPYKCNLSSEAIQVALDAALAGTGYLSEDWNEERESFIDRLKGPQASGVVHWKPTVHAELAMVMAMVKGEIMHVLPYIGVSKLSCIMCSHYIRAFNEVMEKKIAIRGSHGKAYPGWSWPIPPARDEELRRAFLKGIRQQLHSDFECHAETYRRRSDSSVGSGGPEWQLGRTEDDILELWKAPRPTGQRQ